MCHELSGTDVYKSRYFSGTLRDQMKAVSLWKTQIDSFLITLWKKLSLVLTSSLHCPKMKQKLSVTRFWAKENAQKQKKRFSKTKTLCWAMSSISSILSGHSSLSQNNIALIFWKKFLKSTQNWLKRWKEANRIWNFWLKNSEQILQRARRL